MAFDPNTPHHFRTRDSAEVTNIVKKSTQHCLVVMAFLLGKVGGLQGVLKKGKEKEKKGKKRKRKRKRERKKEKEKEKRKRKNFTFIVWSRKTFKGPYLLL